jgi:hypothetical protein
VRVTPRGETTFFEDWELTPGGYCAHIRDTAPPQLPRALVLAAGRLRTGADAGRPRNHVLLDQRRPEGASVSVLADSFLNQLRTDARSRSRGDGPLLGDAERAGFSAFVERVEQTMPGLGERSGEGTPTGSSRPRSALPALAADVPARLGYLFDPRRPVDPRGRWQGGRTAPSPRASGTAGPRARSERPSSRWGCPQRAHTICATRSSRSFDEFDPCEMRAGGGRDRRRPCKLVPLSYLSTDANRREGARRAENPYSGISQSGNQRDMSSSHGSSAPSWALRRSSRSESRAFSPPDGTNG